MSRRTNTDPKDQPPVKRIRLTIEWVGACSEDDWIAVLIDLIEEADFSRVTRVVEADCLTHLGTTEAIPREELIALGYRTKRPPGRGFWGALLKLIPRGPYPWGFP